MHTELDVPTGSLTWKFEPAHSRAPLSFSKGMESRTTVRIKIWSCHSACLCWDNVMGDLGHSENSLLTCDNDTALCDALGCIFQVGLCNSAQNSGCGTLPCILGAGK